MSSPGPRVGALTLGRSFLLWLLGVLVVTLVLVSALVLWHERRILEDELQGRAELLAHVLGISVASGGAPEDLSIFATTDVRAAEVRGRDHQALWRFGPPPTEAESAGGDLIRFERRVIVSDDFPGADGVVEVTLLISRGRVRAHLAAAAVRLVVGLGLALSMALIAGLVLVSRVVRPLDELAGWARRFDPEDPAAPPTGVGSSAEVRQLVRAFGDMAARLADQRRSLVASERRFRELFTASPTPLMRVDRQLRIREANPAAEPFLEGGRTRAVGRELITYLETTPPILQGLLSSDDAQTIDAVGETSWKLADGSPAEVELRVAGMGEEASPGFLIAVHDLSDRLRRMGERWRRTFDAMVDGVALVDPSGRLTLANRALEPHQRAVSVELDDRLAGRAPAHWRCNHVGRVLDCSLSRPDGLEHAILVVRDITESVDAEERLRAAEKMQAVGTLAAGVAHDFNNLLAAILLHARLIERQPETAAEAASAIARLAREGTEVVNELLYVARREGAPPTTVDLIELVRRQEEMLRHLLAENVKLELELDQEPVPVVADPVGLRRLLLNLVLNAGDAVSDDGGTVTVKVEHAAGRAVLEVADDGPGIPDEARDRLFEPFFTLRRHGRGSGLGLAVVYSIVAAHNGDIDVRSQAGAGSRFIVRLPLGDVDTLQNPSPASLAKTASPRILLVESDGRAAAATVEALAASGLDVRHAPDLAAADEIAADWTPQVVVVSGATRPRGGGPRLRALQLPTVLVGDAAAANSWGPRAVRVDGAGAEKVIEILRELGISGDV